MKPVARLALLGLLALVMCALSAGSTFAGNGTTVYRFANEPFTWVDHFSAADPYFPGPAAVFGQDVEVHYTAMNSETVRFHGDDVSWTLIQHGTATVYPEGGGDVLYEGPFQVEEHAKDIGGDAGCARPDGHAWLGGCSDLWTKLDWANYQWKITGASMGFYDIEVTAPGIGCASMKPGSGYCWDLS